MLIGVFITFVLVSHKTEKLVFNFFGIVVRSFVKSCVTIWGIYFLSGEIINPETYVGALQTSKMVSFATIVNVKITLCFFNSIVLILAPLVLAV